MKISIKIVQAVHGITDWMSMLSTVKAMAEVLVILVLAVANGVAS